MTAKSTGNYTVGSYRAYEYTIPVGLEEAGYRYHVLQNNSRILTIVLQLTTMQHCAPSLFIFRSRHPQRRKGR